MITWHLKEKLVPGTLLYSTVRGDITWISIYLGYISGEDHIQVYVGGKLWSWYIPNARFLDSDEVIYES